MRRRAYLRAAAVAGLTGASALPAAGAPSEPDRRSASRAGPESGSGWASVGASAALEPAGTVPVSNETSQYQAAEAVTTDDGAYAFVSKVDGFHVVDLRDPAAPAMVATREDILADEGGPLRDVLDLKYDDDGLLVAAPGNPRDGVFEGVVLFDVTDRSDPAVESVYRTNRNVHNSFLDGRHAYLTAGAAVEIVDMAAEPPERIGEWAITDYDDGYHDLPGGVRDVHDVYVQDERAYFAFWDAGTWILDVGDPTDPVVLGRVGDWTVAELQDLSSSELAGQGLLPPGNDHYAQPNDDGTVLAVGKESWEREGLDGTASGGPSGITLWDVSEPADPSELATIDPPPAPQGEPLTYGGYWTTAHNFDLAGGYLYSSWYRGGVRIHDVSDPTDPAEVAAWESDETTSFWTARAADPGEYFVASSFRDPEDPASPGGLYAFPDPTDHSESTPSATDAVTTAARTSGPTAETATAADEPDVASGTPTETTQSVAPTDTQARRGTDDADPSETTAADGPGFGLLAGAAALGAGAWGSLRPGRDSE